MKPIPGGTIRLGNELDVTLDDFCLDAREVTVADYAKCVASKACNLPEAPANAPGGAGACNQLETDKLSHPINCVSWQEAHDYCARMNQHLPTESQWEYAARGHARTFEFLRGEPLLTGADACWDQMHSRRGTCEVAAFPPSHFGLYDMAGNVSEWVLDWYGPYPSRAVKDYRGPVHGSARLSRGGAWLVVDPSLLRSTVRIERPVDYRGDNVGFRCASAPES